MSFFPLNDAMYKGEYRVIGWIRPSAVVSKRSLTTSFLPDSLALKKCIFKIIISYTLLFNRPNYF